ncbi:hypothetical protein HY405_01420 [Candidatus Microgenomates bacterium]|nr:hypothetical protein [Candidatus Microgenomates bacterium]
MTERKLRPEPKQGTKTALVLEFLRQGKSRIDITNQTGFELKHVTNITYKLRGLFEQSDEERRRERRRSVSLGTGGVWALIEPFAGMGMFTIEIYEALIQERGNAPFNKIQIGGALASARYFGYLEKLIPEDRTVIMKDARLPKEVLQERVRRWIDTKVILTEYGLEQVPVGRKDWLLLSEILMARPEDRAVMNKHARLPKEVLQERVKWWLGAKAVLTECGLEQDPVGRKYWLLLSEFVSARREMTNRNKAPLDLVSHQIGAIPPADLEILRPYIDYIRDKIPTTPRSNSVNSEPAMVLHGEVTQGEAGGEGLRVITRYD